MEATIAPQNAFSASPSATRRRLLIVLTGVTLGALWTIVWAEASLARLLAARIDMEIDSATALGRPR